MGDYTLMPNESFDIRLFNKGIISNIDAPDVLPEAAVWSQNIDSQSEMGTLKGIPEVSNKVGHSINFKRGAIISKTIDSVLKYIVVYTDEATIKVDDNVLTNDTANTITTSYNSNGTTFQTLNDLCYIGNSNNSNIIAGYVKDGLQFNGSKTFSGTGANDLSVDITDSVVASTVILKVKIVRAGIYQCTINPNNSNPDFAVSDSNKLPVVGDIINVSCMFYSVYTGTFEIGPFFSVTDEPMTVSSITENTFKVNYIFPDNPNYNYTLDTASFYFKDPLGLSKEIAVWTDDTSTPTYTGMTAVKTFFTIREDYKPLSNNIKISFAKNNSHLSGDSWVIKVNPVSDLFFIESDSSVITPSTSQGLTITGIFSGSPGPFVANAGISYAISYIYDFLTESPLYTESAFHFLGAGAKHAIVITIPIGSLNKRITGINLYSGLTTGGAIKPPGFYRMLKSFLIAPNNDFTTSQDGLSVYYNLDNINQISNSFESNSGISQDIDRFNLNYTYSTKIDNNLFVARCYHPKIPNAEKCIFKSKTFRFHTFDWTQDFLVLDFIPLGMANFAGKLLVFGTHKTVKINPEQFYIEETIEGIGCKSHDFITTNDDGIFWGDNNYAYHFNGQVINKISITIKNISNVNDSLLVTTQQSWSSFASTGSFCLTDNKRRVVLFVSINAGIAFIWDIDAKRWDFMRIDLDLIGGLTFPDGIIRFFKDYAVDSDLMIYKVFSSSARKSFLFYTKELDFEQAGVEKRLRRVKVDYEGAIPTIAYRVDNQASWTSCTINNILNLEFHKIQFKIIGTATTEVKSISIIYRPLRID